jgi:hypothetical protein
MHGAPLEGNETEISGAKQYAPLALNILVTLVRFRRTGLQRETGNCKVRLIP